MFCFWFTRSPFVVGCKLHLLSINFIKLSYIFHIPHNFHIYVSLHTRT